MDKGGKLADLAHKLRVEMKKDTPTARPKLRPEARWVPLGKQWLKCVADTRPNQPYRLIRVELYDRDRETLIARFERKPMR